MPLAEKMIMTARALSCRKERKPAFRGVVGYLMLVFEELVASLLCFCSLSSSFGRLMSLHVGPTPPDIFWAG